MKKNLTTPYVILILIGFLCFTACDDEIIDSEAITEEESLELKKGSNQTSTDQSDLYGDLWVMERDNSGVPVIYPMKYQAYNQDVLVEGIIDVVNPKLDGSFELEVLLRDDDGYIIYESSTDPDLEPVAKTEFVLIEPIDGYVVGSENVISLYDAEGEVLTEVANHVTPIEMGRLNIIRSPSTVLSKRMTEVIKNFGDGTVANVTRDFCGRVMMLRTEEALAEDNEDKPIDSPLENLAIYKELLLHGFDGLADANGLNFLIEEDLTYGGFDFKFREDNDWGNGAKSYSELINKEQLVMNMAAACISAGSDKTSTLLIDEIVFVNLFMGIPEVSRNDIYEKAEEGNVTCFLPTICQEVRMMNKTTKEQYSKYIYYIDLSSFDYDRTKFEETYLDYVTIVADTDEDGNVIGSHTETLVEDLTLDQILKGEAPLTQDAIDTYRYTTEGKLTTGAVGFASQADDYVQALEVVHNNEEFLVWDIATPTFSKDKTVYRAANAPFTFEAVEESHSKKPSGKGEDSSDDDDLTSGSGRYGRK
ncbi:hypothetical protein [Labilibaculum sp.]|uniref:hypothetical protein n=1 Tax=Labilibaculum sp. TaxID=2060723 RepID=UPI0035652D65